MTEIVVSGVVAVATGLAAFVNRIHSRINRAHERINAMDNRFDNFEVRMISTYVPKADLEKALNKIDAGMHRLDEKLDRILMRHHE